MLDLLHITLGLSCVLCACYTALQHMRAVCACYIALQLVRAMCVLHCLTTHACYTALQHMRATLPYNTCVLHCLTAHAVCLLHPVTCAHVPPQLLRPADPEVPPEALQGRGVCRGQGVPRGDGGQGPRGAEGWHHAPLAGNNYTQDTGYKLILLLY